MCSFFTCRLPVLLPDQQPQALKEILFYTFSALALLVGRQEGRLACKN